MKLTVAKVVQGTLHTASPLELTSSAVANLNLVPDHRADVGSGSSEDTGAVTEVQLNVTLIGGRPSGSIVVLIDIRVLNDDVGVEMVDEVLTHGELEPVGLSNHSLIVEGGLLDDLKLVTRANTAPHEDLGGTESTGRENNAARVGNLDNTRVAGSTVALELDAGDAASVTDQTPDGGVGPKLEVVAAAGSDEVGGEGTSALAVGEHEGGVAEGVVLLVILGVGVLQAGPAGGGETVGEDVEALILVEDAVHGRVGGAGDTSEHAVGCGLDVLGVPALGEVVVPVKRMRLFGGFG